MARRVPRGELERLRALDVLAAMRRYGLSLTNAANRFQTDPRTVLRHVRGALVKRAGQWVALDDDHIVRKMNILTPDGPEPIEVGGIRRARAISRHLRAVGRRRRDPAALATFQGRYVVDTSGRRHAFLTDLRALDRLESADLLAIDDAYSLDR